MYGDFEDHSMVGASLAAPAAAAVGVALILAAYKKSRSSYDQNKQLESKRLNDEEASIGHEQGNGEIDD
jgi:hypothetical protein